MSRKFKTPNYEETLNQTIRLADALPPQHLARLVVDLIAQLDLKRIYERYAPVGGEAIAPEVLLGLLFYGYATGLFSSRKIEKATYESIPFRFIAGGLHPDHDTIANFRKTFLAEIKELFVQILLLAQAAGILKVGNISLDGSKIHADASKSHAVSYKRLIEIETQLRQEVGGLFELGEQVDQGEKQLPEGLILQDEIALKKERLENLTQAKAILEERAKVRYEAEQAEYEAKLHEREAKARKHRHKPRGRDPKPPEPGPRDKDQYNFTDPDSRIMKNSNNKGVDQHYNVQVANDQDSLLIVAQALSNHPNDKQEALPTLDALDPQIGKPEAVAMDNGYFSQSNIEGCRLRGIEPYIATGREPHHRDWLSYFDQLPEPPGEEASPKEKMAYKLQTEIGKAIYRVRKCTIEPVIGIIKEILGFRQFSLRGLWAAAGEWCLVCLAFNLKRMHPLYLDRGLI
ncbi:MAG TPA: IS1182 family transposase [Anaerolineaceae bacterium]|jgi:transposase|nr:IS1182 family transposase [Anaerolineaceae bacterium]